MLLLSVMFTHFAAANGNLPGGALRPDPEIMLIDVYKALSANSLREAQTRADALVAAYPNFHLGQLIQGDLLLLRTSPIKTFGAATGVPKNNLTALREEAIARLRAIRERPDPALVPRALLQLHPAQKNVLLMDAGRSRLYLYERDSRQNFRLTQDYYVSQGRLGMDKFSEGDQKTPLGIYYITSRIPGPRLPDFYGPGALPINYPNEWDRVNGWGGSGIWFHGTPRESYSRPPLSSDGCIVLPNPDMIALSGTVDIGVTPVIISKKLEFVAPARAEAERKHAASLLEEWRIDMEQNDMQKLRRHYRSDFKGLRGVGLDAWLQQMQRANLGARRITVELKDISLLRYPAQKEQREMLVASFRQELGIGKGRHVTHKRQYWAREGTHWKIISEVNLP